MGENNTRPAPWYGRPAFVKSVGGAVAAVILAFGSWHYFGDGDDPNTAAPEPAAPSTGSAFTGAVDPNQLIPPDPGFVVDSGIEPADPAFPWCFRHRPYDHHRHCFEYVEDCDDMVAGVLSGVNAVDVQPYAHYQGGPAFEGLYQVGQDGVGQPGLRLVALKPPQHRGVIPNLRQLHAPVR